MKYKYEFDIKTETEQLARSFIKEQFKTTAFDKLNSDEVLLLVSAKAWNDAMSYVGRFVITDKDIKEEMYKRVFSALKM